MLRLRAHACKPGGRQRQIDQHVGLNPSEALFHPPSAHTHMQNLAAFGAGGSDLEGSFELTRDGQVAALADIKAGSQLWIIRHMLKAGSAAEVLKTLEASPSLLLEVAEAMQVRRCNPSNMRSRALVGSGLQPHFQGPSARHTRSCMPTSPIGLFHLLIRQVLGDSDSDEGEEDATKEEEQEQAEAAGGSIYGSVFAAVKQELHRNVFMFEAPDGTR